MVRAVIDLMRLLRVVLMSATVDAEKLSIYMKGAPVLQVPGRTFPVSSYFLEDAIEQSGYSLDPSSDSPYLTRFNKKHPPRIRTEEDAPQLDDEDDQMSGGAALSTVYSKRTRTTLDVLDENAINFDLLLMLLEKICIHDQHLVQNFSHAILIFLPVRFISPRTRCHVAHAICSRWKRFAKLSRCSKAIRSSVRTLSRSSLCESLLV